MRNQSENWHSVRSAGKRERQGHDRPLNLDILITHSRSQGNSLLYLL